VTRASLEKNPFDVASMFDKVARRYDLLNDVLALGQVRVWRRRVVEALEVGPGDRVLDLAAGTATSSAAIAETGAEVLASDFSSGMMAEGRRRQPHLPFVGADAMHLPFADGTFDAVTISFGLRNVHDPRLALSEMARVTRPGGTVLVCEFSTPVNPLFRTVYLEYIVRYLPEMARAISSNPAAYEYLFESILQWPDQSALHEWLEQSGLESVQWRNLSGGIVALHRGRVPGA
jgi:demethylmenaquinone methyltransferase / 2-methoxy-6-polyprenyl-1,4-benzoquinol methylase